MADAQRALDKHFAQVKQAKSDKLKAKQAQKRAAAAAQGLPSPTPKLRVKYMKILPQAVEEDGEKEPLTWYHRRMNQGERVLKLTNLYAEFQRIIKRQVAYHFDQYNNQWEELPVHLLDEIKDLEASPSEALMTLAVSEKYREKHTGKTLDKERILVQLPQAVLGNSRWREYTFQNPINDPGTTLSYVRVDKHPMGSIDKPPAGSTLAVGNLTQPTGSSQLNQLEEVDYDELSEHEANVPGESKESEAGEVRDQEKGSDSGDSEYVEETMSAGTIRGGDDSSSGSFSEDEATLRSSESESESSSSADSAKKKSPKHKKSAR